MKKNLLPLLLFATVSLMAQSIVQVSTMSDLKAALKNAAVTTIQLTADMPDDEVIGEYVYNASERNFVGKKILDLNGHKVLANAYIMYYTLLSDTLVITGNGTWDCGDSPYGFDLGDNEAESATAGVLIIENGTFKYSDSYAFLRFGWDSDDYLPQTQVIINGGTFNITSNYGNFLYSGSTKTNSTGIKPKVTINNAFINLQGGELFRIVAADVVTVNGGSFLYKGSYAAAPYYASTVKIGTGKLVYLGGQAFSGSTLNYDLCGITDPEYLTTLQVANSAEDFVDVALKSSSEGTVGLEVAVNKTYYPSSGKFLKNTPFTLKALAMPTGDKAFNGWGEVVNITIADATQKEIEFSIGEKNISAKAFFGSNMPTDFVQNYIHYYITNSNEVKIGSGYIQSGDGLVAGHPTSIDIPATVTYNSKTYNVVSIADYAFYGNTTLRQVECESGSKLQNIGAYAFAGCTALYDADFYGTELWYWGPGAFCNCSELIFMAIDDNYLSDIPDYCFYGCTKLQSITNWGEWSGISSIGAYAFANCSKLTNYSYGEPWNQSSMNSYGSYAFANCTSFTEFTIPTSVNELGSHVFDGCSLEWIKVPYPTGISTFDDTSFPLKGTVYIPCDDFSTLVDPTWETPNWNLVGYKDVYMPVNTFGAEDNEHMSGGYGDVSQVTDCANKTTFTATAQNGNRFFRWNYTAGSETVYNYENPLVMTYSMEAPMVNAEFVDKNQVIIKLEYETEDGKALPSDFGGVSFFLQKYAGTNTAYNGPSVWRKCEKYDEMAVDYDYITMTAIASVNDYRYGFAKWKNSNATTPGLDLAVDRDTVLIAVIRELPKYTCAVSVVPAQGGSATLVYGDNVTEAQYYSGSAVKFYATPATGWEFSHWDDDLTNTDPVYVVLELSEDETHVAHFKKQVTLTYGPETSGTGTVTANTGTSGSLYWSDTHVTLTATPADGYEFVKWSDNESANPIREITVGYENATYTAVFQQIIVPVVRYTLELHIEATTATTLTEAELFALCHIDVADEENAFVTFDNGVPVMKGEIKEGETVSFMTFSSASLLFDHWKDNDATGFARDVVVNSDMSLTIVVSFVTYQVAAVSCDESKGSVQTVAAPFSYNDMKDESMQTWSATLTATAKTGYKFLCWISPDLYELIMNGTPGYPSSVEAYYDNVRADYEALDAKGSSRDEEDEFFYQLNAKVMSANPTFTFDDLTDELFHKDSQTGAVTITAVFVADGTTGIKGEVVESQKSQVESRKLIRNGQLLIIRDGKTYNAIGARVE